MAEQVTVSMQDTSQYHVALELARQIAGSERGSTMGGPGAKQDRDYWLKLYLQCRSVVFKGTQIKAAD